MSQIRLREIKELRDQKNEQAQEFRKNIAAKTSTPEQRKEAKTKFDALMDEIDVLGEERDEIVRDNEREARATRLETELRTGRRLPQDAIGGEGVPAAIAQYDRALRMHSVSVTRRGGQLVFKNSALTRFPPTCAKPSTR